MGIKFIDPNATKKVVSITDDAIDKDSSDLAAYQEDYDIKHLKFLEGSLPTYFIITNVGSTELTVIQQDHYKTEVPPMLAGETLEDMKNKKVKVTAVRQGEMMIRYFRAGCKKLIDGTKEVVITDELAETLPPNIFQELGSLILQRSILPDSKKK